MRAIVGCEFSAIVRGALRRQGIDAWSCDLLPTEGDPKYHYQGDIFEFLKQDPNWDLGIFHPPCTYLTNAGVRHLYDDVVSKNGKRAKVSGKERWAAMYEGADFFQRLADLPIPKIAIENPIPHKYARRIVGNYTQLVRPWQFGEKQTKAICLWLKDLPNLKPTKIITPPKPMTQADKKIWHKVHYTSPGPNRAKERSRFFVGVADAMATQWK